MNCPSKPLYELQAKNHGMDDLELTLWELPSVATPHIAKPLRIAGLKGRNLSLVESMILRRLNKSGIRIAPLGGMIQRFSVDEELALNLGAAPAGFLLPCAMPNVCGSWRSALMP